MKCRGRKEREKIVKNYQVTPMAHIRLLAGQTKRSDAEADIINEYYIFEAIDSNGNKEFIQCGMGAARDFLELLNHEGLPLFNPLHAEGNLEDQGGGNLRIEGNGRQIQGWNETARQLYNAVMWLIIAWDAKPDTPLFEFKNEIIKYKNCVPFDSKIKRVNTIIQKDRKGRTLTEIINGFSAENDIRDDMCQFNLLNEVINNMTDRDGNPLNIQSFF